MRCVELAISAGRSSKVLHTFTGEAGLQTGCIVQNKWRINENVLTTTTHSGRSTCARGIVRAFRVRYWTGKTAQVIGYPKAARQALGTGLGGPRNHANAASIVTTTDWRNTVISRASQEAASL